MTLDRILLLIFLSICTSCFGQEKANRPNSANIFKPNPTVIRKPNSTGIIPGMDSLLVSQYVRSIFQDSKGNLWFGTLEEGVVRYDVKTLTYFDSLDGFKTNSVHAIAEDRSGHLWFGTEDQGVYKYDGKYFKNYNKAAGLSNTSVGRKSILVDKSGNIWVGTMGGVFRYIPSADSTGGQCFSLFDLLPPIHVEGIMEDKNGNIWFASSNKGVFRYDGKSIININEMEGLGDNYAGGMAQDKSGNIWFISKTGICKFDGKTFTEFTSKDGIGGTEIWGIFIEESGIIWITARGSTTRFDPSVPITNRKAFTVFTVKDGLNCCVQSMYQDRLGNMWFGTGQGLYRFDGIRFYQVKQNGPW